MKRTLNLSIILLIAGFAITSCSKSTDEAVAPQAAKKNSFMSLLNTPEGNAAFAKAWTDKMGITPETKSTGFITPFFMYDGFGTTKDIVIEWIDGFPTFVSGEIGFFNAPYGPNDFWKDNGDGTVSVHLSSNQASATHFNMAPWEISFGENCHLTMNYTGELFSDSWTDPDTGEVYVWYWIDTSNSPCAIAWQANGKVRLNGEGPKKNLLAHVTASPGGQVNSFMNLN